jgi:hypothetical protein
MKAKIATTLMALMVGSAMAEDMVKLELTLPEPVFAGTPKTIRSANLERAAVVPAIMVPKGTVNVAAGKPVTSSDDFPVIGELGLVTDGDKEGSDGSYVELGPGVQWVQIDLGEERTIYAVAIWHYHQEARAFRDVIVQISDDPGFTKNVQTIFNNDHDNSAGMGKGTDKEYIETNAGKLIDAKGAKGRYVRLYSNGSTGSDMNQYIEVEVYGS